MGIFKNLFGGKKPEVTSSQPSSVKGLDWPDTTNWVEIDASIMKNGLVFKLPPTMKYYLHEQGVTLWINDEVTHSINKEGGYNSFDMQENRDWINDPDNREDIVWLIDEPNFCYFTGTDTSANTKNQETHSCFGQQWLDNVRFHIDVDGITINDDYSYNLSQQECLTFVSIFRSMNLQFVA